jgi:DNA-binding FrmR family transcriptional regulator
MQPEARDDVLRRLRTIQGHVSGLVRMVEQEDYCIDVINQVVAVQRSLDKVAQRVLESHLQTCVRQALSDGHNDEARDRVIGELLAVYQKAANL